jgi:hypothetical protein
LVLQFALYHGLLLEFIYLNEKKTEFIEHMSVNEIDSIRNIEVIIDELHVKQNISQSDIDIVVNNLCDLFSKSSS